MADINIDLRDVEAELKAKTPMPFFTHPLSNEIDVSTVAAASGTAVEYFVEIPQLIRLSEYDWSDMREYESHTAFCANCGRRSGQGHEADRERPRGEMRPGSIRRLLYPKGSYWVAEGYLYFRDLPGRKDAIDIHPALARQGVQVLSERGAAASSSGHPNSPPKPPRVPAAQDPHRDAKAGSRGIPRRGASARRRPSG